MSDKKIFNQKSRTDQSHKESLNINRIMQRYSGRRTRPVIPAEMICGDFSDVGDYQEQLQRITRAKESFMRLPARVRERFSNDPSKLLEFVQDGRNYDEAVELGLIKKKQPQTQPVAGDGVPADLPATEEQADVGDQV